MSAILVVEDDRLPRRAAVADLEDAGLGTVTAVEHMQGARDALAQEPFDLVLLDLGLPRDADDPLPRQDAGLEIVTEIVALGDHAPDVIVVSANEDFEVVVDAMRRGARDYLRKPFDPIELLRRVENTLVARRKSQEVKQLRRIVEQATGFQSIISRSPTMTRIESIVERVASRESTVLISGATGTGKELVARALHFNSPRREKALVTVNCPAIPSQLMESELFGHVKGAFTDARTSRRGKVEMAAGGTLFLDEIGDLDLGLQAKVLRLIQEKEFERVGSSQVTQSDVRIVAATHRDLEEEVAAGRFREDLFYRLAVVPIRLPALQERSEDIQLLAEHFLERFNASLGTRVAGFEAGAIAALQSHSWPGNVRELQNIVERLVNLVESNEAITESDVFAALTPLNQSGGVPGLPTSGGLRENMEKYERLLIEQAMSVAAGNKTRAAELLAISRPALYDRLALYGLND